MSRPRRAFTLIELLGAAALSALLMTGVAAALAGVARDARALANRRRASSARAGDAIVDLVRADLSAALRIKPIEGGFTLAGFGSLDPTTLAPTHRPCRVTYRIERADGDRWLVRDEIDLIDSGAGDRWRERAGRGVGRIRLLWAPDQKTRPTTAPTSAPSNGRASQASASAWPRAFSDADGRPMPDGVELLIDPEAPGGASADRWIQLR